MFLRVIFSILFLAHLGVVQAAGISQSSVIDLSRLMQPNQLLEKIAPSRVVYVSETHDRYDHHLNQLAIIESQQNRYPQLAIGLEFIQQPFQAVLDDFIQGRIDEKAMLEKTEYFERWGYDYRLYQPIFHFAREHGIPLIALNIDRDITNAIKSGGIESLNEAQKNQLPNTIDRGNQAYRERLHEIFMQHPHAEEKEFETFMEIQLLWDESMAARAAEWLKQNADGHLVILAGSGHIIYGSGIPDRLQRRIKVSQSSVINAAGEAPVSADMGDYVIMSEPQKLPASGKLGVFLDSNQSPPGINGFLKDSGAEKAGLKKNDRIIRIDDHEINSYFDIRYALMNKPVDETVEVEVRRKGLLYGNENHSYEVILK